MILLLYDDTGAAGKEDFDVQYFKIKKSFFFVINIFDRYSLFNFRDIRIQTCT